MKYVYVALFVLGGSCVYLSYRLGNAHSRLDCDKEQAELKQTAVRSTMRIQQSVDRAVTNASTADIRRVLREQYTIAD